MNSDFTKSELPLNKKLTRRSVFRRRDRAVPVKRLSIFCQSTSFGRNELGSAASKHVLTKLSIFKLDHGPSSFRSDTFVWWYSTRKGWTRPDVTKARHAFLFLGRQGGSIVEDGFKVSGCIILETSVRKKLSKGRCVWNSAEKANECLLRFSGLYIL